MPKKAPTSNPAHSPAGRKRGGRQAGPKEAALREQRAAERAEQDANIIELRKPWPTPASLPAGDLADMARDRADEAQASAEHDAVTPEQHEAVPQMSLEDIDALHDQDDGSHASDGGTLLITDAAESYDLSAYTRTLELLHFKSNMGRFRAVRVHPDYVAEQAMRYSSGLFVALEPDEFSERVELKLVDPIQQPKLLVDDPEVAAGLAEHFGPAKADAEEETTVQVLPGGMIMATGPDALGAAADAKLAQLERAQTAENEPRAVLSDGLLHRIARMSGLYARPACPGKPQRLAPDGTLQIGTCAACFGTPAEQAEATAADVAAAGDILTRAAQRSEALARGTTRKGRAKPAATPPAEPAKTEEAPKARRGHKAAAGTPPTPPAEGKGDDKPEGDGDKQPEQPAANPRAEALKLIDQLLSEEVETVLAERGSLIDVEAKLAELKAAIEAIPETAARGNRRGANSGAARSTRTDLPKGAPETAPDRQRADGTKPPKLLRARAEGPFLVGALIKKGKYTAILRDTRDDTDREYSSTEAARGELVALLGDVPVAQREALHAAATARLGKDGTGR